jgi:hypothetical protein
VASRVWVSPPGPKGRPDFFRARNAKSPDPFGSGPFGLDGGLLDAGSLQVDFIRVVHECSLDEHTRKGAGRAGQV